MSGDDEKRLMLLFSVGDELFACDAEPVLEVVPSVKLKEIPKAPSFIAGLLNYGGQPVPVIDFCRLLKERPAAESLHTRIILFDAGYGLIAERVTETTNLSPSEFEETGLQTLPFLGGILSTETESVQLVLLKPLFEAACLEV